MLLVLKLYLLHGALAVALPSEAEAIDTLQDFLRESRLEDGVLLGESHDGAPLVIVKTGAVGKLISRA